MNIAVIGTGYVGLVSGTCFAEAGNHVICVDNDPEKLRKLNNQELTIYEPGLEQLFERNVKEDRLHFTDELARAVEHAEVIFLALPTPPMEDGSADLQYVLGVAADIAGLLTDYRVIVNKSTVPVGTAAKVRNLIEAKTDVAFDVVSNPEFLREGVAVNDFLKPDRVVIGTSSDRAREVMERLYKPFVRSGNPIYFMDEPSAEMTKYAANSFLATKISFMNEIANLAERVGANVDDIRLGVGSDSRIGTRFLFPGVGYGGSCFPKDVQALAHTSEANGYGFQILRAVMDVNQRQKHRLVEQLEAFYGGSEALRGKTFAVWGLAFKPNTDDIREAPALVIIRELLQAGARVKAFDPVAIASVKRFYPDLAIDFADNMYSVAEDADALLIVTEWSEFRTPDFDRLYRALAQPIIFDGRNLFDLADVKAAGFRYSSIGRSVADGRPEAVRTQQ